MHFGSDVLAVYYAIDVHRILETKRVGVYVIVHTESSRGKIERLELVLYDVLIADLVILDRCGILMGIGGVQTVDVGEQNQQIHVYINENDSLIYKLQQDVERLSTMMDELSADTLVLELKRTTISE